jgi:histidinol-phosphatase
VTPLRTDDLAFAHELADAADAITLPRFRAHDLRVETKPDLTPVSEADRAAEEAIRSLVARTRREEDVLGEELGGDSAPGGGPRWIVDPIDGTRNYVRGVPVWATLLALERDGVVEVGLVSAPALGRRWWALRGEGAWADGRRVRVSDVSRLDDAVVSGIAGELPPGWTDIAAQAWSTRGFGDFWQHCLVAEGAIDVATDRTLQLWDYAPIQIFV